MENLKNKSCSLPAYSPAIDTPCYTAEPRPDEERIQINRRLIREESGVYVEKTKHVTLALTNQAPNCTGPTYGKGAQVQGVLSLTKPEGVISVEVKLEGVMEFMMTSVIMAGNTEIPLFTAQEVLFRRANSSSLSETRRTPFSFSRASSSSTTQSQIGGERCPFTLTFCLQIPATYSHNGISRPLPPSYSAYFGTIPAFQCLSPHISGLILDTRYYLQATIIKKGSLVDKKTVLTTPITFLPRSRPSRPALPASLTFLSTLKSSPEEWKLFENETCVRKGHERAPVIRSALLLPQSQIFPLNQPIPFHLQLSSASPKLLAPFTFTAPLTTSQISVPSLSPENTLRHSQPTLNIHPSLRRPQSSTSRRSSANSIHDNARSPQEYWLNDNKAQSSRSGAISTVSNVTSAYKGSSAGRINISIQRHVAVEVLGQWTQMKETLSTCTLQPCAINDAIPHDTETSILAWDGQLEVLEEHRVCGGFGGPGVRIKDFILLSIILPDSEHSSLQPIHHLLPIRLTTDPYNEELIHGMELARQPGIV